MLRHIKKIFFQIRLAFYFDTAKRHALRKKWFTDLNNSDALKKEVSQKKWGVSYSVFDGEELLEASISSIRSCVDYVNVVYQDISWFGTKRTTPLLPMLKDLQSKGLVDEIIFFEPDFKMQPTRMERKKRNLGLKYAKKAKCDYFMSLDCDEFFIAEHVKKTQEEIIRKRITHSYCPIVSYGVLPTMRSISPSYCIPFFSKVSFFCFLSASLQSAVCRVDPTRTMARLPFCNKIYFFTSCNMHHMSVIRNDLQFKIDNSVSLANRNISKDSINNISDTVPVEDIFHIEKYCPELIQKIREQFLNEK